MIPPAPVADGEETRPAGGERLLSLDAFRGGVIVMMFLVNVAGRDGAFPTWFPHRGWDEGKMGNGLADYVFPWFLFIVGVAIPFSMNSGRGRAMSTSAKIVAALRRGLVIYLLGTLMWCASIGYRPADPATHWSGPITWRVLLHWDILPLIGWGYFLGVCLSLCAGRRTSTNRAVRISFVALVLIAKWAILTQIPHPDHGRVVWEQSHSLQQWINGRLGWVGVGLTQGLPAAACVVLGSLAGDWLRRIDVPAARRAAWLGGAGLVAYGLALAAHLTLVMPASKDFFTSSYVLGTAGAAAMALAGAFWIVDIRRLTKLTFFRIYGMNALAAYIGAELMWKTAMIQWHVANPPSLGGSSVMITAFKAHLQSMLGTTVGSWALVGGYILFYWVICWQLYRRRVFLKV